MNKIEHKTISTNGIEMHVTSIGTTGPAILFLHAFPELWYSWRHQLLFFSDLGFHTFAPDLRGFSDTGKPLSPKYYTFFHLVGDILTLLDHFLSSPGPSLSSASIESGLLLLSVPLSLREIRPKILESLRDLFVDDYYVCRFQVLLSIDSPWPPVIPKATGIGGFLVPASLPRWLSEEDITYYARKHGNMGFYGGFNYYRAMVQNWELTAPWTGVKVEVPAKFIVGEIDFLYHVPGMMEYIHNGGFKRDVPKLEEVVVINGAAHFVHLERAEEINNQQVMSLPN